MKPMVRIAGILSLTTVVVLSLLGASVKPDPELLFVINRSPDINQVHYVLNRMDNRQIDLDNPIRVFWVKHTEGGKTEPLTRIQNRYAYGVIYVSRSATAVRFHLAGYSHHSFLLQRRTKGTYHVFTSINGRTAVVEKVYVHIEGGSFLRPNVQYVKVYGKDISDGHNVEQTVYQN